MDARVRYGTVGGERCRRLGCMRLLACSSIGSSKRRLVPFHTTTLGASDDGERTVPVFLALLASLTNLSCMQSIVVLVRTCRSHAPCLLLSTWTRAQDTYTTSY